VSEPDENEDLPFTRSSIAAIGARRRWPLFGKDGEPVAPGPPDPGDEPPSRGMLGSLAGRSGPEPRAEPEGPRSLLSLGGAPESAPPDSEDPVFVPLTAHSTLGELAGLEEHSGGGLPIERGVLISLVVHVLLVVLLITVPAHVPQDPEKGLFAAFVPAEKDNSPIPVVFQESPGPARENPKRSPLSDADRRASGGDPSRPKSESPFVPPSPGIAGLAPGPRSPRVPAREAARPGSRAEAGSRAALESSASPDQKPSEFPADMRPQLGSGPREISKLAGLDRAIQEAARSAVGGEGGAPPGNPDGGFVDSGPLSFDTKWYDWGPYGAEMVRRIKLHWDVPELARLGWKGSLTIRFFLLADGTVDDAKIIRSSGIPPFDFAALQAILKSSAFRPLPAELNSQREGVTVTFFYNMRPEDAEVPGKTGKGTP
jgi:TonB family protein